MFVKYENGKKYFMCVVMSLLLSVEFNCRYSDGTDQIVKAPAKQVGPSGAEIELLFKNVLKLPYHIEYAIALSKDAEGNLFGILCGQRAIEARVEVVLPVLRTIDEVYLPSPELTSKQLDELLNKFPNARMLDLSGCASMDSGGAEVIMRHPSVKFVLGTEGLTVPEGNGHWKQVLGDRLVLDCSSRIATNRYQLIHLSSLLREIKRENSD